MIQLESGDWFIARKVGDITFTGYQLFRFTPIASVALRGTGGAHGEWYLDWNEKRAKMDIATLERMILNELREVAIANGSDFYTPRIKRNGSR